MTCKRTRRLVKEQDDGSCKTTCKRTRTIDVLLCKIVITKQNVRLLCKIVISKQNVIIQVVLFFYKSSCSFTSRPRVWQLQGVGARQEETAVNGGFHVEGSRVRRDGCDVGFTFDTVTRSRGGDNGFAAIGEHFAAFLVEQPA